MTANVDKRHNSAQQLHDYLMAHHWRDDILIGPDPGVRFNYRIFRFIKSWLPMITWNDDLYYLQGQGYWVLGNWALHDLTNNAVCTDVAVACSHGILAHQREDGAWEYPNPEWKGRVATAEGAWAAIGLLESYRRTGERDFLDGALRWHQFTEEVIGYQEVDGTLAVNYFAGRKGGRVPNNTAFVLRFQAELAQITGDDVYLKRAPDMVAFMNAVQTPSGEIPYTVPGEDEGEYKLHFQCFQYNAFQFLDVLRYHELTGDQTALEIARRTAKFLVSGLDQDEGYARYDCDSAKRTVTYHTCVMAAAFARAAELGLGEDYANLAEKAYHHVLNRQRPDGSFPHSRGDYGVLRDLRTYPRYMAMILYHLLHGQHTFTNPNH